MTAPRRPATLSRRSFLGRLAAGAGVSLTLSGGLAACALGQPDRPAPGAPAPRFGADPFSLGVASGYP